MMTLRPAGRWPAAFRFSGCRGGQLLAEPSVEAFTDKGPRKDGAADLPLGEGRRVIGGESRGVFRSASSGSASMGADWCNRAA